MDHGKGHSRVTCNIITQWKTDNGGWNQDKYSATIGNAMCAHDTVLIFHNTFKDKLNSDLKQLRTTKGLTIAENSVILGQHTTTNSDETQNV